MTDMIEVSANVGLKNMAHLLCHDLFRVVRAARDELTSQKSASKTASRTRYRLLK